MITLAPYVFDLFYDIKTIEEAEERLKSLKEDAEHLEELLTDYRNGVYDETSK
jgi:hypothetical protein